MTEQFTIQLNTTSKQRARTAKSIFKTSFAVVFSVVLGVVILLAIPSTFVAWWYYWAKETVTAQVDAMAERNAKLTATGREMAEAHLLKHGYPETSTDTVVSPVILAMEDTATHVAVGGCRSIDGKKVAQFRAEFCVTEFGSQQVWDLVHLQINGEIVFPKPSELPAE